MNECGAECKVGADRDEDGTMDVWCLSEGYEGHERVRFEKGGCTGA